MTQDNNVISRAGKGRRQASRELRVVLADNRVGPPNRNVMRKQPTVVGMVVDNENLEQGR